jgi:hypothetical protein
MVYFEFSSPEDRLRKRVSRIVIALLHPEALARNGDDDVTLASHTMMAIERLIDIVTLIAYRQIPRPCLLSRTIWFVSPLVVLPLAVFRQADGVLEAQLRGMFQASTVQFSRKKLRIAFYGWLRNHFSPDESLRIR